MKYCCTLLLSVLLFSCAGKKQAVLTPYEQEVYSVLNALLPQQDYLDTNEVVAQGLVAASGYEISGLEKEGVSREQVAQIYEQAKDTTVYKLDTGRITGNYRWLPLEKEQEIFKDGYYAGWDYLMKEYNVTYYNVISKPLFSADFTVAIVALHSKSDWRSGSGGTYLLRKRNSTWQVVRKIRMWMS